MSGIQGFPSNQKVPLGTGITNNFVTVIPTDPNRAALDNLRFAFRVDNPTVPRTAGVGTGLENADGVNLFWVEDVGTPARVGDFFRAINGNAIHLEIPIVKVETNRFLLAVNSGLLPASGDDFYIMRYTTQRVDENGSQVVVASPGPSQFVLDGLDVEVERDTTTPANSKPFPVINLDNLGVPVDFATETTLAAIDTKTPALVGGAVPVTGPLTDTQLRAAPVPISAASLPLPTGASTEATLGLVEIHTEAAAIILNEAATGVQPLSVSATALPLPTGAATEATLSAMSAKLPATLGQKAMAASMAVTIASDQSTVPVSASSLPLPTGAATETTLDALNTKINSDFGASTGATRTAAQVGNATGSADFGAGNSSAQTLRVVVATDQTAVPISQASNTGAFSQTTNLINSAQTIAAPLNAIGFKIQAPSTNTENVSFSVGSTATMTAGILMEPGRSEDFDVGSNISVIAPSATLQTVNVLWKIKP